MRILAALSLVFIFALLLPGVQKALRRRVGSQPRILFLASLFLSAVFCALAAVFDALGVRLAVLAVLYTLLPTTLVFLKGPKAHSGAPSVLDLAAILLLWLPLEFSAGQHLIPARVQGSLHTVAYGIAVTLALLLFLIFRQLPGMKYNLPLRARDWIYPWVGFVIAAPILIVLGLWLSFIQPFHFAPNLSAGSFATTFLLILAATALPEEILFRSLIQNWLMQRFGPGYGTLLLAGVIFGCAHLNNGPAPPNWPYMILATIAGVAYGMVFQKSSSVLSSAMLHALVNTVKRFFF